MRSIQELAKEALDMLSCNNLSKVVRVFAYAITDMNDIARRGNWFSLESVNEHTICALYAIKLEYLSRGLQASPIEYPSEASFDYVKDIYEAVVAWAKV